MAHGTSKHNGASPYTAEPSAFVRNCSCLGDEAIWSLLFRSNSRSPLPKLHLRGRGWASIEQALHRSCVILKDKVPHSNQQNKSSMVPQQSFCDNFSFNAICLFSIVDSTYHLLSHTSFAKWLSIRV